MFGKQYIAWEVLALCNRERQHAEQHGCRAFAPKQSFLGLVWPWCAQPSILCASKMGRLDNHGVTALCGSSGEDENLGWSIYVDELIDESSRCQLQGGGEEQKSQKDEKESEERSGRWYPRCRRYCVWPRNCRLTECNLLWRPMVRFSIKKMTSNFPPRNWGFGVTTVHGAQLKEFALHPGYTKLFSFGKLAIEHRALERTPKKFTWTDQ